MIPLFRFTFGVAAALLAMAGFVDGAELSRTPSEGPSWVNVRDFGAEGLCRRVFDGAMNKSSANFISASAHFTEEDVGKPIYVLQAGAQKIGDLGEVAGAPLSSQIVSVIDSSTAVLADVASQNVTAAQACWGQDETAAIQKAIDSLADTGGTVYFPPGLYRITYQGGPGLHIASSNIHLQGSGPASAIFNSTVIFRAKIKDGKVVTEQGGVPVLYAGMPRKAGIENVEVDHLWLGDNGQNYNYRDWGPHGPAVLGTAGKIDHFHFHDLVVETTFLCGVGTDSETKGFSIHHVTVLSSGEHGFYLAGTGSDGDVHDNRIIGGATPMRQGIAVKKKNHLKITHNEVARVEFQGIGVEGDSLDYTSHNVLIADNWLHDLTPWHTDAITIFNAEDVVIRNNRISDTSWIAIDLHTSRYPVSRVVIKDNQITRSGQMNPCAAIVVRYNRLPDATAEATPAGRVGDIVVEDNKMVDCPSGISFSNVSGVNLLHGNRVESQIVRNSGKAYSVDATGGGTASFVDNKSVNYPHSEIAPDVASKGNELR